VTRYWGQFGSAQQRVAGVEPAVGEAAGERRRGVGEFGVREFVSRRLDGKFFVVVPSGLVEQACDVSTAGVGGDLV
jgi:hypothetical protein